MHDTRPLLANSDFPAIFRKQLEILQVNLGYLCNLSCVHCHVNAGPKRTELMDLETLNQVLELAETAHIHTLDLTGGAPEMHPHFQYLVRKARDQGIEIIDRTHPEDPLSRYCGEVEPVNRKASSPPVILRK